MKTILALSLGVLMMAGAGSATAFAQCAPNTGVTATPYTATRTGSQQMPTFTDVAPAGEPADPVIVSTPQFAGGSQMEPVFNNHFASSMAPSCSAGSIAPSNTQISVTGNGGR